MYTLAGCPNASTDEPDLSHVDGICYIIDSTNSGSVDYVEWYYGASIMHKSGRYIYGDGEYSVREGEDAEFGFWCFMFHLPCFSICPCVRM